MKSALYPEEVTVCALARLLGRPVQWVGDRREDLLASTQAWDEVIEARLGLGVDGALEALAARVLADVGAYSVHPWTASIEVIQVISFLPGPYRLPHYRGEAWGVATNKAPMGPYRGVGRPVSTFVLEALLDRAARRLGMDPVELRLKNLIRPEELPYRSPSGVVWDGGSFVESLERAREVADYTGAREEQVLARAQKRFVGVGVAAYVEVFDGPTDRDLGKVADAIDRFDHVRAVVHGHAHHGRYEGATVRVDPGGTVTATFGLACHGQGHETTLAQVVAEELGARLEDVRVIHGDTAASPTGTGTYASRSAVIGGGAAILASRTLREKAVRIAAHLLEAGAEDVALEAGRASVRGTGRSVTLREIAAAAYAGVKRLPKGMEPGLEATRFYDPIRGTFAAGSQAAIVEVDPVIGTVAIRRYVCVEDTGRVINPAIVEGQVQGAIAQGISGALSEHLIYDQAGQLLTGTLMDYALPTAADMPLFELEHIEEPAENLAGVRGVGEGGTLGPAAALANAVADALAPFGIEPNELPLTPARLWDYRYRRSRLPDMPVDWARLRKRDSPHIRSSVRSANLPDPS